MPLFDEETRELILKKTWCHGQLVLPLFAILYAVEFVRPTSLHQFNGWFLFAAVVFPFWSYISYNIIARPGRYPLRPLLGGGLLVELAHAGILHTVMPTSRKSTMDLLLVIASGLFLIETAAFLCVAWKLRPAENHGTERQGVLSPPTRDWT
jgi:hypothetical protein